MFNRKQYKLHDENQPSWDFFHKIILSQSESVT